MPMQLHSPFIFPAHKADAKNKKRVQANPSDQNKHLLAVAKQAVEIAIEQNETVGMNFIQSNT